MPLIAIILGVLAVLVIVVIVLRSRKPADKLPAPVDVPALPPEKSPAREPRPAESRSAVRAASESAAAAAEPSSKIIVETETRHPRAGAVDETLPAAPDARVSAPTPPPSEAAVVAPVAPAKRDLTALRKGLQQTRGGWVAKLVGLFRGKKEIDPSLVREIEELLLTGDVGAKTTERMIERLKVRLEGADLENEDIVWTALHDVAGEILGLASDRFGAKAGNAKPLVILVVGVNGVGKTTTIGKLASRYKDEGKKVVLAAGDTFRAAAVAQLEAWGRRVGVPVVKGKDASKPSAVVFDAVQAAVKDGADVVIADTAGRLHTKAPLMDELRKMGDAATKAMAGAPHEVLLVLDATTGQNGIVQVREFRDALPLSGIVLTKLDGTAKGGVILGICDEFKLPVRFIGVGEKVDDLRPFDASDFTAALFGRSESDDVAAV